LLVALETDELDDNNCGGWTHTNAVEHYTSDKNTWNYWGISKSIRYMEVDFLFDMKVKCDIAIPFSRFSGLQMDYKNLIPVGVYQSMVETTDQAGLSPATGATGIDGYGTGRVFAQGVAGSMDSIVIASIGNCAQAFLHITELRVASGQLELYNYAESKTDWLQLLVYNLVNKRYYYISNIFV